MPIVSAEKRTLAKNGKGKRIKTIEKVSDHMPRVKCASSDCKYNSPTNHCQYKGQLLLNDCFYHTVNEGVQHFHKCRMYEMDETVEQLQKDIINFFKEKEIKDEREGISGGV